ATQLRRITERENLRATSSEVASWVRTSLGPTLASRRAASLRGSGSEVPPPVSEYSDPLPPRRIMSSAPPETYSAAEHTGPLEPPPSSHQFNENTEIIAVPPKDEAKGASKGKRLATYIGLILVLALAGWAIRKPELLSRFIKMNPPTQPATVDSESDQVEE